MARGRRQEAENTVVVSPGLAGDDPSAVAQLREHWLEAPSSLPYNLSEGSRYLSSVKGDSWPFLHHYVTRLFEGETGGFFVEAGALDGQVLSNTLWLEQELGWSGLLIEPNPLSYGSLLAKHRKAWTSNTCISSEGVTKTSVLVSMSRSWRMLSPGWFMKGSSYELGVTLKDDGVERLLNFGHKSYYMMSCFPLKTYLRALNVTQIDLLSLDTQGSEISIIRTIPWDEVHVRVVMVEIIDSKFNSEFVEYMGRHGYTLVGHYQDYVFVRENDIALKRLMSRDGWYLVVADKTPFSTTDAVKSPSSTRIKNF